MRHNPWGPDVADHAAVLDALRNSSHETLVKLVHEHNQSTAEGQLNALSNDRLIGMLNSENLRVHLPGPVAFGGYFFGITGFHGFHVFSGVIINVIMLIMAQTGVFERRGHYLMIEKAGLYWHFVDLVWVFVFLCFYLI